MRILLISLLLLSLQSYPALAQEFNAGVLPEISLSYRWSEKIQQTIKIESMHGFYTPEVQGLDFSYEQTDIQVFLEGRLSPFLRIAGGYQYRFEGEGENAHRTIQQLTFLQRKTGFRLGHRIRTDQTFTPDESVRWRLRYRLTTEIPLQGQSLDEREFYLILSGEPVYSYRSGKSRLETRLAGSVGYQITPVNKVEMGPDFRLDDLFGEKSGQNLWIKLGWFYRLSR